MRINKLKIFGGESFLGSPADGPQSAAAPERAPRAGAAAPHRCGENETFCSTRGEMWDASSREWRRLALEASDLRTRHPNLGYVVGQREQRSVRVRCARGLSRSRSARLSSYDRKPSASSSPASSAMEP